MTSSRATRGAFIEPGVLASQGWRLLVAGVRRKIVGHQRYAGSAEEICEQIVRRCLDPTRRFFRTSPTSYPELWARDFGRCVPALLALGFEQEVGDTYRYALGRYVAAGHFALVITPRGQLFDFPAYAPDGFAFFVHGLAKLGDRALVARHRSFFEHEIERFAALVIDSRSGLVRRGVLFSEAQDYAIRDSSCYSNCACHLLQRSLDALALPNPLAGYDYCSLILEHFWDGDHFVDDQSQPSYPSGDAQILPFWTGLLGRDRPARVRFEGVLRWMDNQGLNRPVPCRYGVSAHPRRRMHRLHWLNPWQSDAAWPCLGLHLLEVLRNFDHPRLSAELERYRALVERLGCFPEVLDCRDAELYQGPLVMAEDSMLWAANLWSLLREAGSAPAARQSHERSTSSESAGPETSP